MTVGDISDSRHGINGDNLVITGLFKTYNAICRLKFLIIPRLMVQLRNVLLKQKLRSTSKNQKDCKTNT